MVAVYFALDLKDKIEDPDKEYWEPFIYHLKNENILKTDLQGIKEICLENESCLVLPNPIDRRIERQFSAFTFHPHPALKPRPIPIDKYIITSDLFIDLWKIMEGMNFTADYFFPDYAGLVERIKQGYYV